MFSGSPFSPLPTVGEGAGACQAEALAKAGEGPRTCGVSLESVLADMGTRGWSRVLVEGGPKIFGSLFAAHLADRVMIFIAPRILAASSAPSPALGPDGRTLADSLAISDMTVEQVGPDLLVEGRVGEF